MTGAGAFPGCGEAPPGEREQPRGEGAQDNPG